MKNKLLLLIAAIILSFAYISSTAQKISNHPIYTYSAKSIDGEDLPLSRYSGNVVLVVNVASKCGYTPQYQGLQQLYEKHHQSGLEILGFPCNQFRGQEPGSNQEIKDFCSKEYGVTFPMFSKIEVNGEDAHPLFKYLTGDNEDPILWNFEKFLINVNGKVVKRYRTKVDPKDIEADIQQELKRIKR